MRFLNNPGYSLSELTIDVIAGFYRTFSAFGFGFLESAYRRALRVEGRTEPLAKPAMSLLPSAASALVSGISGPLGSKFTQFPEEPA